MDRPETAIRQLDAPPGATPWQGLRQSQAAGRLTQRSRRWAPSNQRETSLHAERTFRRRGASRPHLQPSRRSKSQLGSLVGEPSNRSRGQTRRSAEAPPRRCPPRADRPLVLYTGHHRGLQAPSMAQLMPQIVDKLASSLAAVAITPPRSSQGTSPGGHACRSWCRGGIRKASPPGLCFRRTRPRCALSASVPGSRHVAAGRTGASPQRCCRR
mmetsp:Transcript_7927/g.19668  ORF Transcript_7927/g.19668 Transcript_7927/m.19668 type:complete len:213 (-) Transcript_7927:43-681(-)